MAKKYITSSLLTLCALLSNSANPNCVSASYMKVGQGVVRIDLERQYVNHLHESMIQIQDDIDSEKLLIEGVDGPIRSETELLIDSDLSNYSVLRDYDLHQTNILQKRAFSLAQQNQES